jgi:hypothetical protein
MFPVPPRPDTNAQIVTASGMDTLELVARLQRSDLDEATLNAVRVMADTLCSEYASRPADDLLTEGRAGGECGSGPGMPAHATRPVWATDGRLPLRTAARGRRCG